MSHNCDKKRIALKKIPVFFILFIIYLVFTDSVFAQSKKKDFEYNYLKNQLPPKNLKILKDSYPDLIFNEEFNVQINQWEIKVQNPEGKSEIFYWCNGSMLPAKELKNQEKYGSILYKYNRELRDPSTMTEEQKLALKNYSSTENRMNGVGTPIFFFDFVYQAYSRVGIEKYIKTTTFLGKRTKVHERIYQPLKRVEERIYDLAKTDKEVKAFLDNIKSTDAYFWRLIAGTNRKSFHSLGIAVDIMPAKYKGEIFWNWTKVNNPDGWMLTPLSQRWMPPEAVINIFEDEGFIWGGKWAIWDNMHFEYHPELLVK